MKKKVSILLIMTMITSVVGCNFVSAQNKSDDTTADVITKTVTGSTDLVPIRSIFDSLGYDTNWESTSKTLFCSKNKDVISIQLNSDIATVNGEKIKMNGNAVLNNGSMCVTLASAMELTGKTVTADGTVVVEEDSSTDDSWKENTVTVDLSTIKDDKYEITKSGVYTLTGDYKGEVYINCDGKVKLVLNNANITNENGPAIFFENSKKGIIELVDGTSNSISDGSEYSEDAKGAIFSNDDLEFQGTGSLKISANYKHAIASDDDIDIKECTLDITTAVGDGINSNDGIKIKSGNITLNTKGDGINGKKCVVIDDGTVNITTTGEITEKTEEFGGFGGGERPQMPNGDQNGQQPPEMPSGDQNGQQPPEMPSGNQNGQQPPEMPSGDKNGQLPPQQMNNSKDSSTTTTDTEEDESTDESSKAIKSERNITINGGTININSTDHGIKCDDIIVINDGKIDIKSDISKGIKAIGNIFINGGDVDINVKDEGIESKQTFTMNGGDVYAKSSGDDAINAGGGSGAYMMSNVEDGDEHQIIINGGNLVVDSKGDGLDSNGNLIFYGGNVTVYGPTSGGDGALDSTNINRYSGGTVMAIGSVGMAECPDPVDGKSVLNFTLDSSQNADSAIAIMDSANNTIYSTVSPKEFQSVIFASDDLKIGEEYSLYINGEKTASIIAVNGVGKYGNSNNRAGGPNGDGGHGFGGMRGNKNLDKNSTKESTTETTTEKTTK